MNFNIYRGINGCTVYSENMLWGLNSARTKEEQYQGGNTGILNKVLLAHHTWERLVSLRRLTLVLATKEESARWKQMQYNAKWGKELNVVKILSKKPSGYGAKQNLMVQNPFWIIRPIK